jgi:hypothetical protein
MTNEEFERLKESIKAKMDGPRAPLRPPEETPASRKLNRDMDRIERVLTKIVSTPKPKRSRFDERRAESEKDFERRRAEIREIGARSDAKLKALRDALERNRGESPKS